MTRNTINADSLLWLMLGLTLGSLPHFIHQPLWLPTLFMMMIGWRLMNIRHQWPLPSKHHPRIRGLHIIITLVVSLFILKSYGNIIGRDAGVALLTVMLGLKVVEIKSHREYYLSCFLGYFVVVTNFFYSQTMPMGVLMIIVTLIITTSIISLNDPKHTMSNPSRLKLASQILGQAIPLMLLLFLLFPRISGPLWGLPQDAHSIAKTGIDNTLTLGKISQLVLSDDVAFRVQFDGDIPEPSLLYWRGPVLWQTDGTTWYELNNKKQRATTPTIHGFDASYSYTSTLEPHNNQWLFALDLPTESLPSTNIHITVDGQLRSNDSIAQRRQYRLNAQPHYAFNADNEPLLSEALELPENFHPRARQLAQQWRQQTLDPQALIDLALSYFNQHDFYYTLSPPQLHGDSIDQFLFESKRGFCEHFAASFTILMRAAGLPARIVTGYQGGEINPVDNFLVIRQQDAHAWSEVWLNNQGWVRIDPTASVSQQRIEQGITTMMPINRLSPFFMGDNRQLSALWQTLRHNWDALDNAWNQWVLAYGPQLQKQVLSRLGMASPNWKGMVFWLSLSVTLALLLISVFLFYPHKPANPIVQAYQRFCRKCASLGVVRRPSEGPRDFANRVQQHIPSYSDQINHITALFINLHYGYQTASLNALKQAVRQFKPRK